jgi:ABC-type transport system involved in multi-copper enzyme maturation permease subunit
VTAAVVEAPEQRFRMVVAAEWTKLRTLRSSMVALVLTIVGTVGVAALICAEFAAHWKSMDPTNRLGTDPVNLSLNGWYLTQLIVAAIAVITITAEHGTGLIRTTFAAMPRRRQVLAAKVLVVAAAAFVAAVACSYASFFLGQRLLHSTGIAATLATPGAVRVVTGAALYVTLIALLGLGLGTIVRSTAGAISTLFGILFVPAILADAFPASWHDAIQKYAPLNAGSQIMNLTTGSRALSPWAGLGVLAGYVAVTLVAATVLISVRDV